MVGGACGALRGTTGAHILLGLYRVLNNFEVHNPVWIERVPAIRQFVQLQYVPSINHSGPF